MTQTCDNKSTSRVYVETLDGTHRFAGAAAKIIERPATILQPVMVLSYLLELDPTCNDAYDCYVNHLPTFARTVPSDVYVISL